MPDYICGPLVENEHEHEDEHICILSLSYFPIFQWSTRNTEETEQKLVLKYFKVMLALCFRQQHIPSIS